MSPSPPSPILTHRERQPPPKREPVPPTAPPKLDRGSYGPANRLSQVPPHPPHTHASWPRLGRRPPAPPTNLEPLHAEFLLLQLPARRTDLLLQPPLLLRTGDGAAGRLGGTTSAPFALPPPRDSRGLPGLQGGGAHAGRGGEGAAEALTQQRGGRGGAGRGRGLPRPDSAEAWPSRNGGLCWGRGEPWNGNLEGRQSSGVPGYGIKRDGGPGMGAQIRGSKEGG